MNFFVIYKAFDGETATLAYIEKKAISEALLLKVIGSSVLETAGTAAEKWKVPPPGLEPGITR